MTLRTKKYRLPDQGFVLVRWAHDLAHGRTATVVDAAVREIRRSDGALVFADLAAFRKTADGPLSVLRRVLELEAMTVRHWGREGFARFHRRSAGKRAEQLCRERGLEAAVDWVLASASNDQLQLDELRDMLGARLYNIGAFDEDFFRAELARALHERRRQHKLGQ